jgi:LysM repeat protein
MIVAVHVILIGGFLMVGCKDANKEHASTTTSDETTTASTAANTTSNTSPMSAEMSAPTGATAAPTAAPVTAATAAPVAGATAAPVASVVTPVASPITPVTAPMTAPVTAPAAGASEYVVKQGDILATIAKKNGVTLKALEEANPGLDPKKLKISSKIQIPAANATASSTSSSAGAPGAMADANNSSSDDSTIYTVKSGDVLAKIAKSHGTTVKAILAANDMKTTLIKPNQKLKMPPVMKVASADTAPTTAPAVAPTPATAAPAAPAAPTGVRAVAN